MINIKLKNIGENHESENELIALSFILYFRFQIKQLAISCFIDEGQQIPNNIAKSRNRNACVLFKLSRIIQSYAFNLKQGTIPVDGRIWWTGLFNIDMNREQTAKNRHFPEFCVYASRCALVSNRHVHSLRLKMRRGGKWSTKHSFSDRDHSGRDVAQLEWQFSRL